MDQVVQQNVTKRRRIVERCRRNGESSRELSGMVTEFKLNRETSQPPASNNAEAGRARPSGLERS